MHLIYEDRHVEIYHQPGPSPRAMVITFNNMQMVASGDTFWGKPVMEKLGLPAIGVMSRARNWFPMESMDSAAPVVRRLAKEYSNVIAYGASMGGYGALKHGKRLGATHSVAFSPQHSIDPAQVHPWDKRYSRYYDSALHGPAMQVEGLDMTDRAHIFFDPFLPPDHRHVRNLVAENANVALHKLFCAGHEAVSLFAGTKTIDTLIEGVTSGDLNAIHGQISQLRRTHKNRRFHLLKTLLFRKRASNLHSTLLENADTLDPALLAELMAISARYAMYRKDIGAAYKSILKAVEINPQHQTYRKLRKEIESRQLAQPAFVD
ncbi:MULTISPECIES: hypothetical protein [unclassified Sphingobium]|uniref:hypothetical protein n=1 Tax=unclassified Sphingobium TaxID=2611147 RepID=UPI0035A70F22